MHFLKLVRRFWCRLKFEFEAGFNKDQQQQPKSGAGKPVSPQEIGRRLTA